MSVHDSVYVTPGHPVAAGAGYDCCCGECLSRRSWIRGGFSLDQATAWTAAGFATPSAAKEWTTVGVDDPAVAQLWSDAGFIAAQAAGWIAIEDITPSEAASCANGCLTAADVERIRRADPSRTLTDTETACIDTPDFGIEL